MHIYGLRFEPLQILRLMERRSNAGDAAADGGRGWQPHGQPRPPEGLGGREGCLRPGTAHTCGRLIGLRVVGNEFVASVEDEGLK